MLDLKEGLEPPYLTSNIAGFGGQIRATVDDFVVEEIPLYAASGEGQHLYVRLTKREMTTKDVERALQRIFKLPRGAVGFAGMKDKQAVTTQTFSLNVGHQSAAFAEQAAQRIEESLPVQVEWAKFHANKLKAGHLLGNRFAIVVRNLTVPIDEALAQASRITSVIEACGLPNYFGPQRFGISGGNVDKGRALLLGKHYVKDKWLRRFLISAYQSFLCNCYLALRLERDAFRTLLNGDIAKKVETGGLFAVEDLAAEQKRYAAQEISFTAPMYGAKMRPAQREAGALEDELSALSGVSIDQWRKVRIDGTRRLGRILVPDIAISSSADGDQAKLRLSFTLPKGAFATTVLREYMKVDLSTLPDVEE